MTIRILAVAAVAGLIAVPAAAQTIRVSTTGKTTAEIQADIRAAAHEVCWANYAAMPMPLEAYGACVSAQVRSAKAQLRTGMPYAVLNTETILR
jgi:hypothetical protein